MCVFASHECVSVAPCGLRSRTTRSKWFPCSRPSLRGSATERIWDRRIPRFSNSAVLSFKLVIKKQNKTPNKNKYMNRKKCLSFTQTSKPSQGTRTNVKNLNNSTNWPNPWNKNTELPLGWDLLDHHGLEGNGSLILDASVGEIWRQDPESCCHVTDGLQGLQVLLTQSKSWKRGHTHTHNTQLCFFSQSKCHFSDYGKSGMKSEWPHSK